jgi:hypothetical protein
MFYNYDGTMPIEYDENDTDIFFVCDTYVNTFYCDYFDNVPEWFFWSAYKKENKKHIIKNKFISTNNKNNIILNRKMMLFNKRIYTKKKRRVK